MSFKGLLSRSISLILLSNIRFSKNISDLVIDVEFEKSIYLFKFSEIEMAYKSGYTSISLKDIDYLSK